MTDPAGLSLLPATLVFLLSLPLAVLLGSAILSLQDLADTTRALVRLLGYVIALLLLLLISGPRYAQVVFAGIALVWSLHIITYTGLRLANRRRLQNSRVK